MNKTSLEAIDFFDRLIYNHIEDLSRDEHILYDKMKFIIQFIINLPTDDTIIYMSTIIGYRIDFRYG